MVDYAAVAEAKMRLADWPISDFARRKRHSGARISRTIATEQGETLLRFACFEVLRQQCAPSPGRNGRRPGAARSRGTRAHSATSIWRTANSRNSCSGSRTASLRACQETARSARHADRPLYRSRRRHRSARRRRLEPAGRVSPTVSVGAPPDEFNPAGQDWGLAPFNPQGVPADDFAPLRQLMRASMRYAGAIRLDHVLGLKRLFMIPHGSACRRAPMCIFRSSSCCASIAEESAATAASSIGEDLGTVPEGFRDTMAQWGLWTYRVMLFERDGDGRFRPPEDYPAEALATFNTHDLPSFRGWLDRPRSAGQARRSASIPARATRRARGRSRCLRAMLARTRARLSAGRFRRGRRLSRGDAVQAGGDRARGRAGRARPDQYSRHGRRSIRTGGASCRCDWRTRAHDGLRRVAQAFAQAGRREN